MQEPKFINNTITILASTKKVWNVLTHPEETKKYMFGCETVSDWNPGSELLWRGEYEGKPMVFVKGHIVEINPEKLLIYTVIDPNSNIDDLAENYLTVTYRLTEIEGNTILEVTQGDYSKVAEGERRYQEAFNSGEGWNPILIAIKGVAETK